jgi:hypothetical protein
MNVNDIDSREYRYESRDGTFKLKCWWNGKEDTLQGALYERPGWLVRVVDVARVAGHIKHPVSPPPEEIIWFQTDSNNTLTKFIELNS